MQKTPLLVEKLSIKHTLLSITAIQILFYCFAIIYLALPSSIMSNFSAFFNDKGLASFAFDMWLVTLIISGSVFLLFKTKVIKRFPVNTLIGVAFFMVLISLFREVNTLLVLFLNSFALAIVLKFFSHYFEQQYLKQIAIQQK